MEQGIQAETIIVDADAKPTARSDDQGGFFLAGLKDYLQGFKKWDVLLYLAYADVRRRYRRTVIGPFWTTLSLAIFVTSMGTLFSFLWHTDIKTFLPFFASGFVVWTFFSTMITESCTTFIASEGYMKQVSLPYSFYAYQMICRNFMVFLHQFVVYLVIAVIFHIPVTRYTLLAVPGLLLLIMNCSWIAISLGLLCTRYRDVQQIVISLLQISMFVTPLFWPESQLGKSPIAAICINLNPLYHIVSVVRYPLLGRPASTFSWEADIFLLVFGWIFSLFWLSRNYKKLIY